jgi:hypothetical protein
MAKDFFEGIGGHEQFFKKPAKKKAPSSEVPPIENPMNQAAPLPSEEKLQEAKHLHAQGDPDNPDALAAKLEKEAGVVPHEPVNTEEPQPEPVKEVSEKGEEEKA